MPEKSKSPFNFWEELKRRKVLRVIAMYAGFAYIVIELTSNLSEPLHLPSWFGTLIVMILIVGFPIITILSWFFDITPQGIKKTESAEIYTEIVHKESDRRRLKLSDGIIVVLVVIIIILIYPKVFKKDRFENIRDKDGRISITVMPFNNMTADTAYDIWEDGIQINLISKLTNSEELSVRQYETINDLFINSVNKNYSSITPVIASDISGKLDAQTFVLGNILKSDNNIRLIAQIGNSLNKEIFKTYEVDINIDDNILSIVDSLSNLIKNYLEIEALKVDAESIGIGIKNYSTSSEAYKYYILGIKSWNSNDYSSAIRFLKKAIEIDSNFVESRFSLSRVYYDNGDYSLWGEYLQKILKDRDKLSFSNQLLLDRYVAWFSKNPEKYIEITNQLLQINDQSRINWLNLGWAYMLIDDYKNAIQAYEKAIEISNKWGQDIRGIQLYTGLMEAYHETGNHKREKEIGKLGLNIDPDHPRIIQRQAVCALTQGDAFEANNLIEKYRTICKNLGYSESMIVSQIARTYKMANIIDKAEELYRQAAFLEPSNNWHIYILSWFLIDYDIDIEEGLALAEDAQVNDPDNHNFYWPRGLGYYKQGKYEEALTLLKKYYQENPWYDHDLALDIERVEKALANQN